MTGPRALWLPYGVPDLDAARDFYTVHLGLSEVDGWHRDGERGTVLRAGEAYVELVEPGPGGPTPLAFELADAAAVDSRFVRWRPRDVIAAPHRYPRGHYGFEVRGPAGARVMVWSEK